MQLRNEIPDSFWSLFRSVNREVYIDALLCINEEYLYSNYFLTKEVCVQVLNDMNARKRFELLREDTDIDNDAEFDMLETPASRVLNWLLKSGWLKKIDDYNTLVTNIVIPDYAAVFIDAFEKINSDEMEETDIYQNFVDAWNRFGLSDKFYGWDAYGKDITDETDFTADGGRVVLNAFMNKMQIGDIVFSCYSASNIDAIGVVIGDYEWHEEYENLRRLRRVKWIVKDIRENILELNGGTAMTLASVYRLWNISISDVYNLIEKHQPTKAAPARDQGNYVFIIDEINRGNISKILGELITLLEPEKRMGNAEGMQAMLPYSQKLFGVPKNVYILGTMNTADRSIAALDTALRRRFQFREMLPDAKVLDGIMVEDLSVKEMLLTINRRIAVLYDREHTIGHAYFVPLRQNPSIDLLGEIFRNRILPLLQEYFYEDYEKIRMVLGDNQKSKDEPKFVEVEKADYMNLFGKTEFDFEGIRTYRINEDAFCDPDAYRLML